MTDGRDQNALRRPVVVTAILLVAIAVLTLVVRSWPEREWADVPLVAEAIGPPEAPASPVDEPGADRSADAATAEDAASVLVAPAEPMRVVLLPFRLEHPDPAAERFVDAVRQSMLRTLSRIPHIDVVDLTPTDFAAVVPQDADARRGTRPVFMTIARLYGGDFVAEIVERSRPDSPMWNVYLQVHSPAGSSGVGMGVDKRGPSPNGRGWFNANPDDMGAMFAERIIDRSIRPPPLANPDERRSDFLDVTRSDDDRLSALADLRSAGFDAETIAAAAELASRSTSARTRQQVWNTLRHEAYDTALAQPLSSALLSDPDATVRKEAALSLASYLGEANTTTALEFALANDASAEVRLAAKLSTMDYEAQSAFVRETLLDRSLAPAERLAPTIMSYETALPRLSRSPVETVELTRAFAEIVAGTEDAVLKTHALSEIQIRSRDLGSQARFEPEVVRILLDHAGNENHNIRNIVLDLLRRETDSLEVRAVFEAVVEKEPALAAQLRLPQVLD